MIYFRLWLFLLLIFGAVCNINSQIVPDLQEGIDTIVVSATRIVTPTLRTPRSVSLISYKGLPPLEQGLSLSEKVAEIPGLFALNSNNYAQDVRISIRGFGARSSFGIRGIKLIVDGVPETTPDGQGQVDNLDLSFIESIEILRGPSSSLYGNASGGVISVTSISDLQKSFADIGISFGAFNTKQVDFSAGLDMHTSDLIFHLMHVNSTGYRGHSDMSNNILNLRWNKDWSNGSKLTLSANYTNSPEANDPGGLKVEEVEINRSQARDLNIRYKAGESVEQFKISARYAGAFNESWDYNTFVFYNGRDFNGYLPFEFGGIVDLNRFYIGHGSSFQKTDISSKMVNKLLFGYEYAFQKDNRIRYDNIEGAQGAINFTQNEIFANISAFVQNQLSYQNFIVDAGIRYDINRLEAEDLDISNGDNSSRRYLSSFNPSIGISYLLNSNSSLFGSLSTNFETPTLSELSADPTGTEGFNKDLSAQTAFSKEIGIRSEWSNGAKMEVVLFQISTSNEIIPYELAQFPGRDFYRNAGRSNRKGIELSAHYYIIRNWYINASYSLSSMKYNDYEVGGINYIGNQLPGLPSQRGTISSVYTMPSGIAIKMSLQSTGGLYLDDANKDFSEAYHLVNFAMSYPLKIKSTSLNFFAGVNNVTNEEYYDNVRINAFGSRYFEPGPSIYVFGGVKFRW